METTARLIGSRHVARGTHSIVIRIYRIPIAKSAEEALERVGSEDTEHVVAELRDLADALAVESHRLERELPVRETLLRTSDLLRLATERVQPHECEALHDLVVAYGEYRESVARYLRTAPGSGDRS